MTHEHYKGRPIKPPKPSRVKVLNASADLYMNNKTNSFESEVVRYTYNPAASLIRPGGVWIALFTANPTEVGISTSEVSSSGTGYTRISCLFGDPANGFTINSSAVQFPTSLAAWGNVTHIGVCKSNTRGTADLMYYGPLLTAQNVNASNFSVQFAPGTLTVSEKPLVSGLSAIFQGNATFSGNLAPSSDLDVSTEGDYVPRPGRYTLPRTIIDVKDVYPGAVTTTLTDTGNVLTNATNLRNAYNTALSAGVTTRILVPSGFIAKFSSPLLGGIHSTAGVWTTIEWISKTAAGVRVNPTVMANAPKIVTTSNEAAFLMKNGANRTRLIGLEIYSEFNLNNGIVLFGQDETSLSSLPVDFIMDRCYLHGNGLYNQHGVMLNGIRGSVINCWIDDLKWAGVETQAIVGWAGPGPFRIDNNYLSAASIGCLFGGAEPNILGVHPADILFRRNRVTRPLSYRGLGLVVKNDFEIKHGQYVLVESNVMDNSWSDGQEGMLINLQTLGASWNESKDITVRYNEVYRGNEFIVCSARGFDGIAMRLNRVEINNNYAYGIGGDTTRRGVLLTADLDNVWIEHNTILRDLTQASGVSFIFDRGSGPQASNVHIKNNLAGPGDPFSTVFQSGGNIGNTAINDYGGASSEFVSNVGFQESFSGSYGGTNQFAANLAAVKLKPDGSLNSDSPYLGDASDGLDPGANIADILLAVNGVASCQINTSTSAVATSALTKPAYLVDEVDPDFGTRLIRITGDPGTAVPYVGSTWPNVIYHHYSKDQPWSSDQRLICMKQTSGAFGAGWFLFLDGYSYEPVFTRGGSPSGQGESVWHPTIPDVMINLRASNASVYHWNVRTNVATLKFSVAGYSNAELGPNEGNVSYDGRYLVAKAVRNSDSHIVAFAVDIDNAVKFTDIDLTAAGLATVGDLDWVSISALGGYVVALAKLSGVSGTLRTWSKTGTAAITLTDAVYSHMDLGVNDLGEEVLFTSAGGGATAHKYQMRRLSDGAQTLLTGAWVTFNGHSSTRNYNRQGWGYISVVQTPAQAGFLLDFEIAAIKLSASNQIERLGRSRTDVGVADDYDSHAFAVPSPDGKRIMFASNWGVVGGPVQTYVIDVRNICP